MDKKITLVSQAFDGLALCSIAESDQENLREWKNANRLAFFYQEIIPPQAQAEWFEAYLEREGDWMFVVRTQGKAIGCMGFRLADSEADVYNVILGDTTMGRQGWMRQALRLMCSYVVARFTRRVGARVLRSNPARTWYAKAGFREVAAHETWVQLQLDLDRFQPCPFEERSETPPHHDESWSRE